MTVPIRPGAVYRHGTRLVKLLERAVRLGPGYWKTAYLDGKDGPIIHERELKHAFVVKSSKQHGGGI